MRNLPRRRGEEAAARQMTEREVGAPVALADFSRQMREEVEHIRVRATVQRQVDLNMVNYGWVEGSPTRYAPEVID